MPSTPSSSETQERLSRLLTSDLDRRRSNLEALRRNIEAVDSPVDGVSPRSRPQQAPPPSTETTMTESRERQRLAQLRLTIPVPGPGRPDYGSGILDRVAANYAKLKRSK
jgi:hypothetical protein